MASVPFNNLITFSRGTNATLTGPNGLIQWAPNNLLTNSESFNASAWSKSDATVTANATTAPDGTSTADKLAETATTAQHYLFQSAGAAGAHTATIYAKAAERSWIIVTVNSSNTFFNISSGTVGSVPGGFTAAITDAGNGWYRCSVTATLPASGPIVFSTSTGNNVTSYAGTAGSGIFIWGAQLELGTAATTYNSTTVKNLLGFSEAFDNAAWNKNNASIVTGAQANPVNGAFNAQKLMEDTSNNFHRVSQVPTLTATPYTASIYAKSAGRNWLYMANASLSQAAYFNLNTGVVGTIVGAATATITSVGNGWYRCSITSTAAAGAQNYSFYTANADASFSYTGDGSSGIYIYGAQLFDSASLDPYVPTPGAAPSSTAFYGPRFDYDPVTLAPKGILVEEARTNLILQSQFVSGWSTNAGTTTFNASGVTSPDGTANGRTVNDTSAAAAAYVFQAVSFTSGTVYSMSVYVKKGVSTYFQIQSFTQAGLARFNLATNTLDAISGIVTSATITNAGGGWYRCTATMTASATASNNVGYGDFEAGPTGDLFSVYGAQLEAGAFATSYIPTVASTVTRSADVATITGSLFSQWYTQPQGTFVMNTTPVNNGCYALAATDGTANEEIIVRYASTGSAAVVRDGGTIQANFGTGVLTGKNALAYNTNDFAVSTNGGAAATDTSGTVPTNNQVSLGRAFDGSLNINGHIRSIDYYPARLANFQIQALTELSLVATLNLDFINGMYDA